MYVKWTYFISDICGLEHISMHTIVCKKILMYNTILNKLDDHYKSSFKNNNKFILTCILFTTTDYFSILSSAPCKTLHTRIIYNIMFV